MHNHVVAISQRIGGLKQALSTFIFLFPRAPDTWYVLTKCMWDACRLNDWLKWAAYLFREFMTVDQSKKICSSICEAISNKHVMSVSRSSAVLRNANWLLARVLLEIFLFCKCSSFPQLDRGVYWALPDGPYPKQGSLGTRWIKLKDSEQSQQQEKDFNHKVKPHLKTGTRGHSFSWIIVQEMEMFCSFADKFFSLCD